MRSETYMHELVRLALELSNKYNNTIALVGSEVCTRMFIDRAINDVRLRHSVRSSKVNGTINNMLTQSNIYILGVPPGITHPYDCALGSFVLNHLIFCDIDRYSFNDVYVMCTRIIATTPPNNDNCAYFWAGGVQKLKLSWMS